jgi:DNA replication protein DnaC
VMAAMSAEVLIIDDMGKDPQRKRDALCYVVQERAAGGRQIIGTTELDSDGFAAAYSTPDSSGEYLMRRLSEPPAVVIDFEVLR